MMNADDPHLSRLDCPIPANLSVHLSSTPWDAIAFDTFDETQPFRASLDNYRYLIRDS